ncbi:hypothetical protein EJ110_NYTH43500 [Nymphaea thermarum]|nr:hypothetical protein EJ110_NYTH43500 [Nymphaea thermarum]
METTISGKEYEKLVIAEYPRWTSNKRFSPLEQTKEDLLEYLLPEGFCKLPKNDGAKEVSKEPNGDLKASRTPLNSKRHMAYAEDPITPAGRLPPNTSLPGHWQDGIDRTVSRLPHNLNLIDRTVCLTAAQTKPGHRAWARISDGYPILGPKKSV